MAEEKFDLVEIRDMVFHFFGYSQWDECRAFLTRPDPKFRDGEVAIDEDSEQPTYIYINDRIGGRRPLRLSEMPQAVEDLRSALLDIASDGWGERNRNREIAHEALTKFDAEIER